MKECENWFVYYLQSALWVMQVHLSICDVIKYIPILHFPIEYDTNTESLGDNSKIYNPELLCWYVPYILCLHLCSNDF